jgi:pimeloyl-ACP methyl ester carboxylesterase
MIIPLFAALLGGLTAQPPAAATKQDVIFASGSVQLAGTVTRPTGVDDTARLPAVVLLGGSGPAPRAGVDGFASQLTGLGLVTLTFDKRGSGQSTGDWTDASLDDLAGDATSALTFLAAQRGVDAARVGVWGVSQAGWVIPLLADRSPTPAFCIVVTGGGARPRDVEMYGYRQALEKGGVDAAGRARAEALLTHYFSWLESGRGRAELLAETTAAKHESWYRFVEIDRITPSEAARPKWAWVANFDPIPSIAKMRMPTLVILGAGDPLSPAEQSAAAWRDAFARSGNRAVAVRVFDDMGHAGRQGQAHNAANPISADYSKAVEDFTRTYVLVSGARL